MSIKLRVLAAVLTEYELQLYQEDGEVFTIKQGDPDLKRVLDEVIPFINDGQIAEVTVGPDSNLAAQLAEFEGKQGKLVRFFKVVKSALDEFLSVSDEVAVKAGQQVVYGTVPTKNPDLKSVSVGRKGGATAPKNDKLAKAVESIMENAVSVTSPEFGEAKVDQHSEKGATLVEGSESVIAVVEDKIVHGVDKLIGQVTNANKDQKSSVGLVNFMKRVADVASVRRHSAEDLLKFMERGDLPIADDGCIVAYKVLRYKERGKVGKVFVDCHTGLVPQKLGSRVFMEANMVDPDRRNECSNGLHIARRGYIRGFSGDVCVICKIAPEDVIAVPSYDANKIRVCGYHIVDVLTKDEYNKLVADKPITDNEASKVKVGQVLAGNHVGVLETVQIRGQQGRDIKVTPVVVGKAKAAAKTTVDKKRKAEAISSVQQKVNDAPVVEAKGVAKAVLEAKTSGGSARNQRAQELFKVFESMETPTSLYLAAKELLEFKKKTKVSWDKLGINVFQAERITTVAATEPVFEEPEPDPVPEVAPKRKAAKPKAATLPKKKPVKGVSSKQAQLKELLEKVVKLKDKKAAQELLRLKTASKKSWAGLGLPKEAGEACTRLLAKTK